MCGRYALTAPADELVEAFDLPDLPFEYLPRADIAPGTMCPVVAEDRHGRRMGPLLWGFLPAWKDDPSGGFINARAESITTKASFREAFARRRCLIPADGFFEWAAQGGGPKVRHWVHPTDGGVVSFAGIWESWQRPDHEARHTFAIVTTAANAEVSAIHDRMPVVVAAPDRARWLDRSAHLDEVAALLRPSPDGTFALER